MFNNRRKLVTSIASLTSVTTIGLSLALAGMTSVARAGQPLPYDFPEPPPNINAGILYNQFSSASSFYTPNGTKLGNSHISTDVPILRYVHTFNPIDGVGWGVQIIAPDINFLGNTKIDGAPQSVNSGFAQPQLSAFIFPYSNPTEDETVALVYLLSPPAGAYNANRTINASNNNIVNNVEAQYTHIVFGKPHGKRLDFQIALDAYFYSVNGDGPAIGPFATHVHTQPAGQVLINLPYFYHPQTDAYVGLTFEQTIGGKGYLTSKTLQSVTGIRSIDTGSRNNVTTVGVETGSFLAPTVFAQAELQTTVRVRGGFKNNVIFQIEVGKVF